MKYGFWLSMVSIVCGVGYAVYMAHIEATHARSRGGVVNQQTGPCGANVNGDNNNTSVDCGEKPAGAR